MPTKFELICRAAALLACALPAYSQSTPGFSRKPQPSWIVINSFTSVPGDDIRSVAMLRTSADAAGTWTCCLTTAKLPAFFGGDDQSLGVVMGRFDPYQATFTATTQAKNLNSPANESHLSLHPNGLWAVFQRDDGIWIASRSSAAADFAAPKQVTTLPKGAEAHPHLGRLGGQDQLFHVQNGELVRVGIDLTGAKLLGTPVVIARPLQQGAKLVSGAPLHGADGDAEGLFLSETPATGDCDLLWDDDLDPTTPPQMFMQRADWTNDPTAAGGYLYWAHDILPRWHLMHSEAAWLLGDIESPGGTLDVTIACAPQNLPTPNVSVVFLAAQMSAKLTVPGFGGALGLDLGTLVPFGVVTHADAEGMGVMRIPVPKDPGLKGLALPVQALNLDAVVLSGVFTNTAYLRVR